MVRRGENIRKRIDGRWEGRYIKGRELDSNKIVYGFVYGKTYLEVKNKKKERERDVISNAVSSTESDVFFNNYVNVWIHEKQNRVKISSYNKYNNLINSYITPFFKNKKIYDINQLVINDFFNILRNKLKNSTLSISTVKTIIYILKSIITMININNIQINISAKFEYSSTKATKEFIFLKEDLDTLIEHSSNHYENIYVAILLSCFAGLRIGEICALQWSHIDFKNGLINVHYTAQRVQLESGDKKTKLIIDSPKSASSNRKIPMPSILKEYLLTWESVSNTGSFVLPGAQNYCCDPRTIQYQFKVVTKSCEIKNLNFHALRHTFATNCVELGFDIKTLSEILGHSTVKITMDRYVHPTLESKRIAMQLLDTIASVKYFTSSN